MGRENRTDRTAANQHARNVRLMIRAWARGNENAFRAVEAVTLDGKKGTVVAMDLGISAQMVSKYVRGYQAAAQRAAESLKFTPLEMLKLAAG